MVVGQCAKCTPGRWGGGAPTNHVVTEDVVCTGTCAVGKFGHVHGGYSSEGDACTTCGVGRFSSDTRKRCAGTTGWMEVDAGLSCTEGCAARGLTCTFDSSKQQSLVLSAATVGQVNAALETQAEGAEVHCSEIVVDAALGDTLAPNSGPVKVGATGVCVTDSVASAAAAPLLTGTVSVCDATPRPGHSRICCCVDTSVFGLVAESKTMCPMAELDCHATTFWDSDRNTCWDVASCGRGRCVVVEQWL